uniref:LIM domain transcription factor LMO4 n=1 Tax=Catagonus wagneri TaxID=51154 RepID=A0A8C3WPM1_9CETA
PGPAGRSSPPPGRRPGRRRCSRPECPRPPPSRRRRKPGRSPAAAGLPERAGRGREAGGGGGAGRRAGGRGGRRRAGIYKVRPHCQTCSGDCSSCCRGAAARGLLRLLAPSRPPRSATGTATDTSAPRRPPLTRGPPAQPEPRVKKKKKSPRPPPPLPCLGEDVPLPPAPAPLPRKPSGFARISPPPPPRAVSNIGEKQTMVNPGSSSQPPPVTAGSLSWKRCAGCGGKIADRFLLYAMDSYWHSRCLKCSCCQAQLGDIGTSCYTKSGMILCRNDYIRLFGNSGACSACGQSIPASELVMRAQGNVYHLKCFTCSTCRNRLVPGDRFHYINGSLFCEHDRPTALINGHLNSLQSNPLLPDQKVC